MDAKEGRLQSLLEGEKQFIVPIYQRDYSWEDVECSQLLDDIVNAGLSDVDGGTHFIGSIVSISDDESSPMGVNDHLVIDGQQRLTSLSLLVLAVAGGGFDATELGITKQRLLNRYILNSDIDTQSPSHLKLRLNEDDDNTYRRIVYGHALGNTDKNRVAANYAFFQKALTPDKAQAVVTGLAKVLLVSIRLTRGRDNPQLIFESLNSTGKRLSQTDLIRNYVLMDLEPGEQNKMFSMYWQPLVRQFGAIAESKLDSFMRAYLTKETGSVPLITSIYDEFKVWTRSADYPFGVFHAGNRQSLLASITKNAENYSKIVYGSESVPSLKKAMDSLQGWKTDVAHPMLLRMYELRDSGAWTDTDVTQAAQAVESYIVRRTVCGLPSNSMGSTFVSMLPSLGPQQPSTDVVQARLLSLTGSAVFPRDGEVMKALVSQDLYGKKRAYEILFRLEQSFHPQEIHVDSSISIEHVMPQSIDPYWRTYLGADAVRIHAECLHVLGNLTLTGYNSEFSNYAFEVKRDRREGGFANSPLSLNSWIGAQENWDRAVIENRSEMLARRFCESVWVEPQASKTTLAKVLAQEPKPAKWGGYIKLDDYEFLGSIHRAIYERFEDAIRAVEPDLTVEYFRTGVSFKLGTQVLSVSDQKNAPMLYLDAITNLELQDPEGLCVFSKSGVPRVRLSAVSGIDYVVALAAQAIGLHNARQAGI